MSIVVTCTGISKAFGILEAVRDADVELHAGELHVLLGRSGCGKTTLLRLIGGFERADRGSIRLGDTDITGLPPERRNIGMVFQDYALFPHMNVRENILFGLKHKKRTTGRLEELLELTGLTRFVNRMPHELSGGEQQRVALARALAPQPKVLLLDEPFSNIDAQLRVQIRKEVQAILKKAGVTTLFVTHDQEEAMSIGDRMTVMSEGRILQTGKPEDLYHLPASRQVAEFLGDANFLNGMATDGIVDSPLGELNLVHPVTGNTEILIRPEQLRLTSAGGSIRGTIRSHEFFGHDQMIHVELQNGGQVMARTLPDTEVKIGREISLEVVGKVCHWPFGAGDTQQPS